MPGRALIHEAALRGGHYDTEPHRRRRDVLRDTLACFDAEGDRLAALAADNLARWAAASEAAPPRPAAIARGDWGAVTERLTRSYGRTFAVLNMANAYLPGGRYVEGTAAQEENMFRRTDCHFSIAAEHLHHGRYKPEMSRLLNGEDGRFLLDRERPRTCIRGPEERGPGERGDGRGEIRGYARLPDDRIFSFYELRAAARNCNREGIDLDDTRRRVRALLDTLVDAGQRHAVLGAWGCGAFANPPREVARSFRDELAARSDAFDCVVFAIHDPGYGPDNARVFEEVFGA